MEPEPFREGFQQLLAKRMVEHDGQGPLIALPNFLKYNPPANPNAVKSWGKSLDLLPECELLFVVIQRARSFVEGLGEPFANPFRQLLLQPESREQRAERSSLCQGGANLSGYSTRGGAGRPALAVVNGDPEDDL